MKIERKKKERHNPTPAEVWIKAKKGDVIEEIFEDGSTSLWLIGVSSAISLLDGYEVPLRNLVFDYRGRKTYLREAVLTILEDG